MAGIGRPFTISVGQRFGRLTVLRRGKVQRGNYYWVCQCNCPATTVLEIQHGNLMSGHTRSCGCWRKETTALHHTVHGECTKNVARSPEYITWTGMLQRCYNPEAAGYEYWGGRGIAVCKRWRESFKNFLADMGRRPSSEHTIERINNDRGYSRSNCKWATRLEQARNRRNTTEQRNRL